MDTVLTLTVLLILIIAGLVSIFSIILIYSLIVSEIHARKQQDSPLEGSKKGKRTPSYDSIRSASSSSSAASTLFSVTIATGNENGKRGSGIDSFPKISDPSLAENLLSKFATKSPPVIKALVTYDFEAQQPGDLTIHAGDIITVVQRNDTGWWVGQSGNATGNFPFNYVEIIEN